MQGASQRAIEKKLSGEKELKPFVRTFHRKADGTGVALLVLDRLIRDAHGRARRHPHRGDARAHGLALREARVRLAGRTAPTNGVRA